MKKHYNTIVASVLIADVYARFLNRGLAKMRRLDTLMSVGLLFLCLMFVARISTAVTLDDAIGIWLFDDGTGDTTADSSGNGNDGILMEGPQWVDGRFGKALSFDVEGPFVRIEVPSALTT